MTEASSASTASTWSIHTRAYVGARFPYPHDIRAACHSSGLPLSAALALLSMESGGHNIFGHDPVRRPQIVGGPVTKTRYLRYRLLRRTCGNQGVGPCQLTSPGLQNEADRRGGCHLPRWNMEVGFTYLDGLHEAYRDVEARDAWQLAFQHYNGSGPRAVTYGKRAVALMDVYHRELTA